MENKWYLVTLLTNDQDQDGSTVQVFDSLENAQVSYHNQLASYHNAPDVKYAVVEILNYIGYPEVKEIVDHRPAPEPEPDEE